MAERSIRDFQTSFAVAPVADAWAAANGFGLSGVEPDGSRAYVRGSGLLTGQMICVVRQSGPNVRIEAYVHARLIARIGALFLIPTDVSVEPGGFKGAIPRKMCRDAVDRLLAQLGQPPITSADNAAATVVAPPLASAVPAYPAAAPLPAVAPPPAAVAACRASDARPFGIVVVAIAEVVSTVACFFAFQDYWWAFNYRASRDDMNWAALDLGMVIAYLALAGGCVAVAWRLWSMRRDAWLAAIEVAIGIVAVTIVSGLLWGFEVIGIVGIAVHLGIVGYLNMAAVRAAFGRGALGTPAPQA